uniref:CCN TSP1 domain-containing protein n=1 Tax=Glossina brevipalpis TaxID=37001 RepID=A0A1A9W6U4_9MUSC
MRLLRILTMDAGRKVLSLLIIIITFNSALYADKSTAERIKKHQEWLKQRNQSRNNLFSSIDFKKPIELANLWRFDSNKNNNINKKIPNIVQIKHSINDVYPLEETDTRAVTVAIISTTSTVDTLDTTTILPITELSTTEKTNLNKTVLNANDRKTYDILNTTALINTANATSSFLSSKKSKLKIHVYPRWSNWSKWSACSRSCGDGVRLQQRKCINR